MFKDRREGDAWREEGWSKQGCGLPAEPGREESQGGSLKNTSHHMFEADVRWENTGSE